MEEEDQDAVDLHGEEAFVVVGVYMVVAVALTVGAVVALVVSG